MILRPREIRETVERARAEQTTEQWQQHYGVRAGVEGTIYQTVAAVGIRRSRYLGLPNTHFARVFAAAAINMTRLDAYWTQRHSTGHAPVTSPDSTSPLPHNDQLGNRSCTVPKPGAHC